MKRKIAIVIIVVAWASIGAAQAQQQVTGTVEVGGRPSPSVSQSTSLVSEYEPTDGGALFDLDLSLLPESGSFALKSRVLDNNAQQHELRFDLHRVVRSLTTFTRLPHELGHDSLANLEASNPAGRQLWFTDSALGSPFGMRYGVLDHRTEVQIGSSATVAATFRDQHRGGHYQINTMSHCEGCHVQSQSRPIDEHTRDVGLEGAMQWLGGTVQARLEKREQREDQPYVLNQFDRAIHPELRTPVFDNRVTYGLGEGPLPIDLRPDMDKETARFQVAFPSAGGFALAGSAIWSQTENRYTGLQATYTGYSLSAARILPRRWRLTWRGSAYGLRNDDVFVDVVEPLGTAGPQQGKTYREIYGFDPDWTRRSGLNRDVVDSRLDLSRRIGKRAGNVRFFWSFKRTDRENFEVAPGEGTTTTNILGAGWSTRLARKLRLDARYVHGDSQHPFMLVNGACSTFTSSNVASPLDPTAGQYYSFQDARVADTTASPSRWDELRATGSYVFSRSTLAMTGRWWSGTNQDGDLTDWSRDNWATSVTYTMVPSPLWNWYTGYTLMDSAIESPICIPLFDG